jgi:4-hydroxythreonine-4-phosphate dehydrogenase
VTTQRLALTCGEPAGIGPDLALTLAMDPLAAGKGAAEIIAIADPQLLQQRATQLGFNVTLREYQPGSEPKPPRLGELQVLPVPLAAPCVAGKLNTANASYVIDSLRRAVSGCEQGEFAGMVTAPVQKSVINDAGIPFSGHTELLQELTGCQQVVMMLATTEMRVALATTHLPLSAVPAAITAPGLRSVLEVLHTGLQQRFNLPKPRIAVLGLNPHAGEAGHLGLEEQQIIEPVLDSLRQAGLDLLGPLPADTAFNPKVLRDCDVVLAMYHDQGLPVLKYAGFGAAVNITLGLPIVRTSVDHGTALDLAGCGTADPGSLRYAIEVALQMVTP